MSTRIVYHQKNNRRWGLSIEVGSDLVCWHFFCTCNHSVSFTFEGFAFQEFIHNPDVIRRTSSILNFTSNECPSDDLPKRHPICESELQTDSKRTLVTLTGDDPITVHNYSHICTCPVVNRDYRPKLLTLWRIDRRPVLKHFLGELSYLVSYNVLCV